MNRLGITEGEWKIAQLNKLEIADNGGILHIVFETEDYSNEICTLYKSPQENTAHAKLFVDSGNTAQKCGLLPSELLEQRNELLEACICSFKTFISIGVTMEAEIMVELNNAIKKAEQYGNVLH